MQTRIFTPVAIETIVVWNNEAMVFIVELGWRVTETTGNTKETVYLYQQISVTIQRGNMLCFAGYFITEEV